MGSNDELVQFRAPPRLIDRVDALATVFGEERSDVVVTALRDHLRKATQDETIEQEIAATYYDDEISDEQLETLVGAEAAANFRVLKRQLNEDYVESVAER